MIGGYTMDNINSFVLEVWTTNKYIWQYQQVQLSIWATITVQIMKNITK